MRCRWSVPPARKRPTLGTEARSIATPVLTAVLLAAFSSCVGEVRTGPALDDQGNSRGGAAGATARPNGAGTGGSGGQTGQGDPPGAGNVGTGGGSTGSGAGGMPAPPSTRFACDANTKPPVAGLRRLTMTQLRNTLADLAAWAAGSASAGQAVLTEVAAPLATLPADRREVVPQDLHGSYRRLDQSLQQAHVEATYDVAVALGAALTTAARLGTVVGACATDTNTSNDASCLDAFIKKFGARVFRRPLDASEVELYKTVYGTSAAASAAAYADLIGVLLTAPEALYFVEHGASQVAGQTGVYELTPHELASRLSYQLWQTAPDDRLLAAAANGTLQDPTVYDAEVARMLADARARPALDEFFADWMKVQDLPALDAKNADPVFRTFAAADLPDAKLRQAMIDDVLGMLRYYAWTQPAGIATILTSELSFARDARLAKLYGVSAWNGTGAPPALPAGQRPGLLTRALFLATGSANTRPIMKGVFLRTNVLCDPIPAPPAAANANPPALDPNMTTREIVEEITEMPASSCRICHAGLINPLGFATEGFDALGRFRTEQRLFDASGTETGRKPVNTATIPQVVAGDPTPIASPAELMALMVASGKVEACLSRHFFRFTYGRWEGAADGCALERGRRTLVDGGTVLDLAAAAVKADTFKRRTFE